MLQTSTDQTDEHGKELLEYGTREFPAAFFYDDLDVVTVPWHWHQEFELTYMVRGSLHVRAGSAAFDATAGDAYFVNSSVLHSAEPLCHGAIQKACVFNARLIASSDSAIYQKYVLPLAGRGDLPGCVIHTDSDDQARVVRLVEQAWDAGATNAKHHEITVRNAYTDVLVWLLESAPATVSANDVKRSHKEELRLRQMLTYIEAHYMDPIRLEDIANSAHISTSECLRCFRTLAESTPMQYVTQTRLAKSTELLRSTDLTVTEIAQMCGYQDPSYFTRMFKKHKGTTPTMNRGRRSVHTARTKT